MTKTLNNAFSVFLSVLLLVTVVPMNTFAISSECACGNTYDANGFCPDAECHSYQPAVETIDKYDINDDSVLDIVYEISNAGQLYWFAEQVNGGNGTINGILMNDIVVNTGDLKNYDGKSANDWRIWAPIGVDYSFAGVFDGNHYDVSGLYYNDATGTGVGLFGVVEGVVRNVGIRNSYFYAKQEVGGICGALSAELDENKARIEYCVSDATVIADDGYAGGICGGSGHIITGCYNTGSVTSVEYSAQYTGGIVGYSDYVGNISYCGNAGDVIGFYYTGGICGYNFKNGVLECYNSGNVTGYLSYTGGICGANDSKTTNCFNTGDVLCDKGVGGICGSQGNPILNCYNTGKITCVTGYAGGISGMASSTITNCYNIGEIVSMYEGTGSFVGAICGDGASKSMINCYYLSGSAVDGAGVTQNGIGVLDLGTFAEDGSGTISKTADKFENGEVCYSLNGENAGTEDYLWGETIGYDKYPMLGGEPVFYKESEDKYFNIDYSLLRISHQPTAEEPYIELYEDFRAKYQWYKIEKDLTEITEDNAEKFVSYGGFESSYNNETGWTATMDENLGPHCFSYFTVELEAGDTVVVELSDDKANFVGLFNFNTYEDIRELITSGETTYSLTVETPGEYRLYVTHESNTVTVKASIGEISYNIVEDATDSSYVPTDAGIYACLVTYVDGSTELSEDFETSVPLFTGIKGDYFYKDDVRQKAYQLVEFEGDFYFINDSHKIAKNKRIYLSERFVKGFTYADGTPLKVGYYEFDENGKMIIHNGVVGDYFYKNNERLKAYQIVEFEGDFYFINDAHKLAKNKTLYLSDRFVNGFTYEDGTPLKAGYYTFGENGKMMFLNGPVGDYFYKDNERLKAYQLVEFEGDYYFINNSHKLAKNTRLYMSERFVEGTDLKVGYYEFDTDGKMIFE